MGTHVNICSRKVGKASVPCEGWISFGEWTDPGSGWSEDTGGVTVSATLNLIQPGTHSNASLFLTQNNLKYAQIYVIYFV